MSELNNNCPICASKNATEVYFSENEQLARYGFEDIKEKIQNNSDLLLNIYHCLDCHFQWNSDFDINKINYSSDKIIEAGHFSPSYLQHQKKSAHKLNDLIAYELTTVVEIGAGAGIFLDKIKAKSKIAIEPSKEAMLIPSGITIHNEYFNPDIHNTPADLVIMRQVLEHIPQPLSFMQKLAESFGGLNKFHIYIEVPNSMQTINHGRFYDYYYEHCNYFTPNSIFEMAKKLGMTLEYMGSQMNNEIISALLTSNHFEHDQIINSFKITEQNIKNFILNNKRKKIICWGASGNGTIILNRLLNNAKEVISVVDSDINKQGKYIPGTGHKIISPEDAINIEPDVVLIFSQLHKVEIQMQCRKLFGHKVLVYTV